MGGALGVAMMTAGACGGWTSVGTDLQGEHLALAYANMNAEKYRRARMPPKLPTWEAMSRANWRLAHQAIVWATMWSTDLMSPKS